MPNLDASITSIMENYVSAVAAKDAGAFMRLYDPDVRIFDAWESWVYEGSAAWEGAVRSWFESLGTECVRVTFNNAQCCNGQDLAIANSIVTFTGVSPEGLALRSMQNRITWGIRLSPSGSRIIHEHSSAPIGFSDMKAILNR